MLKRILIAVFVLIIIGAGSFIAWGSSPLPPMLEALDALRSDRVVQVTNSDWIVFQPVGSEPDTGLVFYPGGRVDYRAYSPYLREVASQGFLVVLVKMPLNLAVFAPNRAGEVIDAFPAVKTWAVGGHSLGGAMAAHYVAGHPGQVQGLVLLASYPASSDSLVEAAIDVISIYASQDGLATQEKIDASRALLPAETQFVSIQGGNHAQFGWYGLQNGDGTATISREDQQAQVVTLVVDFLTRLPEE